jgi:hypothetical protein
MVEFDEDVIVRNLNGNETIRLERNLPGIFLKENNGKTIFIFRDNALRLGDNDNSGALYVTGSDGTERIHLIGNPETDGAIRVIDGKGKEVFRFDPKSANLLLGNNGNDQAIFQIDSASQTLKFNSRPLPMQVPGMNAMVQSSEINIGYSAPLGSQIRLSETLMPTPGPVTAPLGEHMTIIDRNGLAYYHNGNRRSSLTGTTLSVGSHTRLSPSGLYFGDENVGGRIFNYETKTGNLKIGGVAGQGNANREADILLYRGGIDIEAASANDSSIHLSASDSRMDFRNTSKHNTIAFDGQRGNVACRSPSDGRLTLFYEASNANLKIGGGSSAAVGDGNILLFRGGTDIHSAPTSQASIHIDGGSGDILLQNAEFAEEFDVEDCCKDLEPGVVLTLNEEGDQDSVSISDTAYDRKVVGVYSGAGSYKPGLILDRKPITEKRRVPVAMMGKVYCKVDASWSPIKRGDLLASSETPGHAMKAIDPVRSVGSILGKALKSFDKGKGLVPILAMLQ